MSWNIGDNRSLFVKLKLNLGFYHVVVTTLKTSPEKPTLIVVEIQQLPNMGKTLSKREISCLKNNIEWKEKNVCKPPD